MPKVYIDLYRGKRKDNGAWVYGVPIDKYGKTYLISSIQSFLETTYNQESVCDFIARAYEVIPESIGKCTALTDMNGKQFFEGDIVRFNHYIGRGKLGVIKFGNFNTPYEKGLTGFFIDWELTKIITAFDYLEVIGNIYDNPELLRSE